MLASISGNACRFGAAAAELDRAIEHARRAGDVRQERRASTQYALAAVYGPTPVDECIVRCEAVAARAQGDRQAEAVVTLVLGQLEAMRGDFEKARDLYRRALATFEELRLHADAATVSLSSGQIELLAGDAAAAEQEFRRGYEELSRLGEQWLLSSVVGLLAEAVVRQGRLDEAEELSRQTEELAADDDVDAQVLWRLARAKVLAFRGQLADAATLASEAVRLVEATDDVVNNVNASACLAWILQLQGQSYAAGELLKHARTLAAAKRSPVMVARLDELETEPAQPSLKMSASA